MPKEVFEFSCPCCGKRVELNTRNGKVRAVHFEESKRGKSFDDLVADQKGEGARLGSMFDEARADHGDQDKRLERLFDNAKKDAKKHPEERPPHPFEEH